MGRYTRGREVKWQRAVVVGASSGIGRELARQLAAGGCRVGVVARRGEALESLAAEFPGQIVPLVHDVKDVDGTPAAFSQLTDALEGLDLLIYSSGTMFEPDEITWDTERDLDQILVNNAGAVAWINRAAERFAGVGAGTIVGIGSFAGDRGRRKFPVYAASKAFLRVFLEGIRLRVEDYGVTVVGVRPGPVETAMTANHPKRMMMPVDVAARKILRLAERPGMHFLTPMHRVMAAIFRVIPWPLFRRLDV